MEILDQEGVTERIVPRLKNFPTEVKGPIVSAVLREMKGDTESLLRYNRANRTRILFEPCLVDYYLDRVIFRMKNGREAKRGNSRP